MLDLFIYGLLSLLLNHSGGGLAGSDDIVLTGTRDFVEYRPGDTNLIISIPHDGFLRPGNIPNRTHGCRDKAKSEGGSCRYPWTSDCPSPGPRSDEWFCKAVTYSDSFTQEIGRGVAAEFRALTGKTPHLVVDNLHRSRMDPNRPVDRAAQGNPDAELAYNEFHNYILEAREAMGDRPGLLIDFHGMTHAHEKIEIGYLFRTEDLNAGDYTKDVPSIQALLNRTGLTVPELLHGDHSLGAMLEEEGYPSIPSPRQPVPGEDKYYRGGHITQIHGSRDGGLVDAIQTEFPRAIRINEEDGEKVRRDFIKAMARVVVRFHTRYYTEKYE